MIAASEFVTDVVVPLVAAGITAIGIVLPVILFRRQEVQKSLIAAEGAERRRRELALEKLRATAFQLREYLQRVALEEMPSDEQSLTVSDIRDRLFADLYGSSELLHDLLEGQSGSSARTQKFLLLLAELEGRLRGVITRPTASDRVVLYAVNTLCYLLEEDEESRSDSRQAMDKVAGADSDARAFHEVLFPTQSQQSLQ